MLPLRSLALSVGAATAVAACGDAAPATAPDVPDVSAATSVAMTAPSLRDAVADARARLAPTLDGAVRAPMRDALGALADALADGDAPGARRALAAARALLAAHGDAADGDAADLAAVRLLLDAAALDVASDTNRGPAAF